MVLKLMEKEYSVYKFDPEYIITENTLTKDFISITRTKDELSVIAEKNKLIGFLEVENGWKIFRINEVLDFNLVGILSKISTILANENISIFVMSTFNTDYIMVKEENVKNAIEILIKNNYEIKS